MDTKNTQTDRILELLQQGHQIVDNFNFEEWFNSIAYHLMNDFILKVGAKDYRLTELEFYYWSKEHPDHFTHIADEQTTLYQWYFNGFGLDLTFGREMEKKSKSENNIYGGILIRGLRSIEENPKYYHGPSLVLKELFSSVGTVDAVGLNFHLAPRETFYEQKFNENSYILVKSERINLPDKKEDSGDFKNRPYRFIILERNPEQKIAGKENLLKNHFGPGKLPTAEFFKSFLGYAPKDAK